MSQEIQSRSRAAHEKPMRRETRERLMEKAEKAYKFDAPQFGQLPSPTESGMNKIVKHDSTI